MFGWLKRKKTGEDLIREEIEHASTAPHPVEPSLEEDQLVSDTVAEESSPRIRRSSTVSRFLSKLPGQDVIRMFLRRTVPGRAGLRFFFLARRHRMKSFAAAGVLLFIVVIQIISALRGKREADTSPLVPEVRTIVVRPQTLRHEVKSPGTITYLEKAAVTSKVQGRMAQLFVDIGDKVDKGSRLGALETFDIMLKIKQSEAQANSALAQLRLADARYQNARREVDRQLAGMERSQSDIIAAKSGWINARQNLMNKKELYDLGGVSESQLKGVYTEYIGSMTRYFQTRKDYTARLIGFRDEDLVSAGMALPAEPVKKKEAFIDFNTQVDWRQVEVARAAHASSTAELESARLILKESTLVSPLAGTVAARSVEIGEEVKQGEPAFTVVRMDKLLVTTGVPEDVLRTVKIGQPVDIIVDAYGADAKFRGAVYKVSPVLDVKTRTAEIKIEIDNKEGKLNPGMFCRASILTRTKEKGTAVPSYAVLNRREEKGAITGEIFVVQNGLVFKRPVALGEAYGDLVEVMSGLKEGEEVAVDRVETLKDGAPVKAKPEEAAAPAPRPDEKKTPDTAKGKQP